MGLEYRLKQFAKSLGFDDVGITSAHGLPFIEEVLQAYNAGRFGPLDYLDRSLPSRVNLQSFFEDAQSVIIVIKNYYTGDHMHHGSNAAKIARYAWGKDYHQWFKKRLKAFKPFLEKECGKPISFWQFNDTGPFLERAWAYKAGLGFIGKSAMFIHRGFGTWTLIGGFATNVKLKADPPYAGPSCGTCTRCIDACPTNAIIAPLTVDARRCISTWTIERPLHEDAEVMSPKDHEWGFGCDVCQEVCPFNKFQKITTEERFQPISGRVFLTLETLEQDLRGSPLHRSKKEGLLKNLSRIKKSLITRNMKTHSHALVLSDEHKGGELQTDLNDLRKPHRTR